MSVVQGQVAQQGLDFPPANLQGPPGLQDAKRPEQAYQDGPAGGVMR